MNFTRAACWLVALLVVSSAAFAQQNTGSGRTVQSVFEEHCRIARDEAAKEKDAMAIANNRELQKMFCNCMPAEWTRLKAQANPDSKEEMVQALQRAREICEARRLSRTIPDLCPVVADGWKLATDIKGFCACVGDKVISLPEMELNAKIAQAAKEAAARKERELPSEFVAILYFGAQCRP